MDQPPRRSSDYANCVINEPDDGVRNLQKIKNNLYLMIIKTLSRLENKYNLL